MRFKRPERVASEIAYWVSKGYDEFFIGDANSIANGRALLKVFKQIEKMGLHIKVNLAGRPNDILRYYKELEEMFKIDCISVRKIEIGIEANTQRMLDLLGRGTTPEINIRAIDALVEIKERYSPNTELHLNIILFPHFDMEIEDFIANVEFIGRYREYTKNSIGARLFGVAGTPVWKEMVERGFKPEKHMGWRILEYKFSDPQVERLFTKLVRRYVAKMILQGKANAINLSHYLHSVAIRLYDSGNIWGAVMGMVFDGTEKACV